LISHTVVDSSASDPEQYGPIKNSSGVELNEVLLSPFFDMYHCYKAKIGGTASRGTRFILTVRIREWGPYLSSTPKI